MKNIKFTPTPQNNNAEPIPQDNERKFSVWGFIFFGIIAALGALAAELILSMLFPGEAVALTEQITVLLFLLVIIEELFKFSVIFSSLSGPSFLLPSFFVSAGFALTEICLAYSKNVGATQSSFYLMLAGVGLVHLTTGLLSGYSAFSYKKTNRVAGPLILLFLAIILHLIYNVAIIKLIKN